MKKLIIKILALPIILALIILSSKFLFLEEKKVEKVKFLTQDNFELLANFYFSGEDKDTFILVHMLNGKKEDWEEFSEFLFENGYNVLAIDLRGHGESIIKNRKIIRWQNIEDFNSMIQDLIAAKNFLVSRNALNSNFIYVGASIGANLGIKFSLTENINALILLSPGLEYRKINVEEDSKKVYVPTFIIVAEKDEYSYNSSLIIFQNLKGKKGIKVLEGYAHGTQLLNKDIQKLILSWVERNL